MMRFPRSFRQPPQTWIAVFAALVCGGFLSTCLADGKVQPPRNYTGSLEEKGQEAVIIFNRGEKAGESTEDLILKIQVEGKTEDFAWIVPFPNPPKTKKEDPAIFKELFDYVQARRSRPKFKGEGGALGAKPAAEATDNKDVEVISREIVGSYEVTVVKENTKGKLNGWLTENEYQPLEGADDVLDFYREKNYVYACIKVSKAKLGQAHGTSVDLHPLRFTFNTGGLDGVYFPMKLTGLQSKPFNVNLYVFFRFWLNDDLNKFGYTHRGFQLYHRDWDTDQCVANGGKAYTNPASDPFLKNFAGRLTNTTKLLQKLHPGEKYYLTNVQAYGLKPADVREWSDDLWMFPYYTNRRFVPFDARPKGAASAAWPKLSVNENGEEAEAVSSWGIPYKVWWVTGGIAGGLFLGYLAAWLMFRRQGPESVV